MNKEVWKVWEKNRRSLWEVSDQGNVKKNGELYECRLHRGYKVFGPSWGVHRAVAILFIPNPENKPCVDHINTNKLDNRACNLRWVTPKENSNNLLTMNHHREAQNKPETKKKKSEAMKGKIFGPQSEETRKKISKLLKGNQNTKGKIFGPQSEEHKRKISKALKIYWQNKRNEKQNH